jgi:hypothetical protein
MGRIQVLLRCNPRLAEEVSYGSKKRYDPCLAGTVEVPQKADGIAAAPKRPEVFDVSICSKMSAESLTVRVGRRRQRRLGGQTVLGVLPQRLIRSGSALPG